MIYQFLDWLDYSVFWLGDYSWECLERFWRGAIGWLSWGGWHTVLGVVWILTFFLALKWLSERLAKWLGRL